MPPTALKNTTDSIDIPTNHNTKQHNFLTNSSLSITGLPWIMAGIALRNERKNIRELRNKFQPHFHHTADNYTQFVPLALTTGLKLAGVEGRSDTKTLSRQRHCLVCHHGNLSSSDKKFHQRTPSWWLILQFLPLWPHRNSFRGSDNSPQRIWNDTQPLV